MALAPALVGFGPAKILSQFRDTDTINSVAQFQILCSMPGQRAACPRRVPVRTSLQSLVRERQAVECTSKPDLIERASYLSCSLTSAPFRRLWRFEVSWSCEVTISGVDISMCAEIPLAQRSANQTTALGMVLAPQLILEGYTLPTHGEDRPRCASIPCGLLLLFDSAIHTLDEEVSIDVLSCAYEFSKRVRRAYSVHTHYCAALHDLKFNL